MNTVRVGKLLYCPQMKRRLKAAEIDAWPGFEYSVEFQGATPVFRIDIGYMLV